MEDFHGDTLNSHNINKLSCTHESLQETQHFCHPEHCLIFVGPEHQATKIYHAFSNYVKTTFNNGLSLSEVDLSHLKREMTNHGSSVMQVDWAGNIDPNYTSSGCMLMQVDWGGKLRVNHINECMPSEVDWGAHETQQNGHSITKVDWGDYDPSLYPMDGCILSEVDWGAQDSSFSSFTLCTLIMMQSQRISSPKDCGEDYHKEHLPPLSWTILDKLKMDFPTPNRSRDIEVHNSFLILNTMKVATIHLLNEILVRNLCNLHSSGRKAQVSSLPKQRGVKEFSIKTGFIPIPNGPRRNPQS